MIEYQKYFQNKRTIFLNEIKYELITLESEPKDVKFQIKDQIETMIKENHELHIIFTRIVHFDPKSLYDLRVSFGLILPFKDEIIKKEDVSTLNFKKFFVENNVYLGDILSRTSQLIAEITSSHGQPPIITPPNIILS